MKSRFKNNEEYLTKRNEKRSRLKLRYLDKNNKARFVIDYDYEDIQPDLITPLNVCSDKEEQRNFVESSSDSFGNSKLLKNYTLNYNILTNEVFCPKERRKKGMGKGKFGQYKGVELGTGITQRKDGIFQGTYPKKDSKRGYVYSKDLRDCIEKQKSHNIAENNPIESTGVSKETYTYEDAFNEYISEMGQFMSFSVRDRFYTAHKFLGRCIDKSTKITDLNSWNFLRPRLNELILFEKANGKSYSRSTIDYYIRELNKLLDYCADDLGIIDSNNVRSKIVSWKKHKIKNVCMPVKKHRALDEKEKDLFLSYAKKAGLINYLFLGLLFETGAREAELYAITEDDVIDKDGKQYLIINKQMGFDSLIKGKSIFYKCNPTRKIKNEKTREVVLSDKAVEYIEAALEHKKKIINEVYDGDKTKLIITVDGKERDFSKLIFFKKGGTILYNKDGNNYFNRVLELMERDGVSIKYDKENEVLGTHSCRATFATHLYLNDIDENTIAMILGDDIKTVIAYYIRPIKSQIDVDAVYELQNKDK